MPSRQDVADAVAAAPERDGVMVVRGDTMKLVARRRPADQNCGACLVVMGPLPPFIGGRPVAIRPANGEARELAYLSHQGRREVTAHRNRLAHATRTEAKAPSAAPAATSAAHGASEAAARPDASAEAPEARTRPEVRAI
jgi:hypothetical protein